MKRNFQIVAVLVLALPLLASECDQFELDDSLEDLALNQLDCSQNESQACYCIGGQQGYQFCDDEGGTWSVCVCEAPCVATEEICDGIDNDCDNETDVNAVDAPTWYADRDNDGAGNANEIWIACNPPTGYVAESGDLDDDCETCTDPCVDYCDDEIDNDCDGLIDEADDCVPAPVDPDAGV